MNGTHNVDTFGTVARKPQPDAASAALRRPVRVLVTGFGAFPGAPSNPTESVLQRLRFFHQRRLARLSIDLTTAVMPVRFAGVAARIAHLLDEHRPDIVIHLGLAARRKVLSVETRALNRLTAIHADATGALSGASAVLPRGETERRSPWLAAPLAVAMSRQGATSRTSIDAGDYLCNQTLYLTLGLFEGPAGFIHMPRLRRRPKKRAGPCSRAHRPSLQQATDAIATAIERCAVDLRRRKSVDLTP